MFPILDMESDLSNLVQMVKLLIRGLTKCKLNLGHAELDISLFQNSVGF